MARDTKDNKRIKDFFILLEVPLFSNPHEYGGNQCQECHEKGREPL
jgi:hypothetical protein